MTNTSNKIIYTFTDEAPALATYAFLPIIKAFTNSVDVSVETRTPSMAAEIANTHVSVAIAYYGELRAKITNADKDLFAEQLQVAEQEYQAAENALADFRTQNPVLQGFLRRRP